MSDPMVLATQRWLNATYSGHVGYEPVAENGQTGWTTVYALLHALQIELGINMTADNFGSGTQSRFVNRWPDGIHQQADGALETSNVYGIIQGALWCKGYSTGASGITLHFFGGTGAAVRALKNDAGIGGDATVTLEIMKALMSMMQFKLLEGYGGKDAIRAVQQRINREYIEYTGLIPADGLYGRELNTALIKVLQALEGYSIEDATGHFGAGTTSNLKTVTPTNAGLFSEWVWLGSVGLLCNGFGTSAVMVWDSTMDRSIVAFQSEYALPKTGVLDRTTWMSLLTSKGDPNRVAVACDTRFEITDEFVTAILTDGYQIVGRYLTEKGMESLHPEDYFKAIRPGELQRLVANNIKYFTIFQETSSDINEFTESSGILHAKRAYKAAIGNRIPPTVIYFAVDMDVLDYQIDSHIIPYFRAISDTLHGYYVGIYASRNVSQRVIDAGYAVSAFVSDMSTGFSGNLGYPIPSKWNYDQFTEIKGYGGNWDLDRVAYSGRMPAAHQLISIDDHNFLEWVIRTEERLAATLGTIHNVLLAPYLAVSILNWLRKPEYWGDYSADPSQISSWRIYTPEPPVPAGLGIDRDQIEGVINDDSGIKETVSRDLAHMAASAMGYITWGYDISPDSYGYGDLGDWPLDLLQIWGTYLREASNEDLRQWLGNHLGIEGDNKGFNYNDVLADADAWLIVYSMSDIATEHVLSDALLDVITASPQERLRRFFIGRFAGQPENIAAAFSKLSDGVDIIVQNPEIGIETLLKLAKTDRLPTPTEAHILAEVYCSVISR